MMWMMLAVLLLGDVPDLGRGIDADQFLRLVQGQHAAIRGIALGFEGRKEFTGPGELEPDPDSFATTFQGTYVYRSDGATFLDVYRNLASDRPVTRETTALLKGRLETLSRTPDLRRSARALVATGGPGSFKRLECPTMILYSWYFQSLKDPADLGYAFQGWEEVAGHRCFRVQLDEFRSRKGEGRPIVRFWIDPDRGCHPLKVEHSDGEKLKMRIEDIVLQPFETPDGGRAWVPVSGLISVHRWGREEYYRNAVYTETCRVIDGSVRVNPPLSDRLFTAGDATTPFEVAALKQARRQFEQTPIAAPVRTDPEGARRELDRKLAVADRQAERLEASSAASEARASTTVIQLVLGSIGVLILSLAAYRWWRWG